MNPYEQFQLNKEVEEMAKQRIEIHKSEWNYLKSWKTTGIIKNFKIELLN
ncbi:hypothetical protein F6Y02_04860 [Bacillus megaterium]|nr:hypothetical protein [Priestia megaterium]